MKLLLATTLAALSVSAYSSDYTWPTSSPGRIDVKAGQNIQSYNHQTGRSQDITVDSVRSYGGTSYIEAYDHKTHSYKSITVDEGPSVDNNPFLYKVRK